MLENILQKLSGVKKTGTGYMACCPAHDDKIASLSISVGESGKKLLHCHAGCTTEAIVAAGDLTMEDLFPKPTPNAKPQIVAAYDYCDENGNVLYQVVRFDPKDFRARRHDGNKWVWNLKDTRRVLFRFPELLISDKAFPVFIVEGEKDVDNLRTIGVTATCNPLGAGKWRDEYSQQLKDRMCVILPHNDDAGEKHTASVARSLFKHASKVSIMRLPDLPDKGDVSDWIAKGNTSEDLHALLTGADNITEEDLDKFATEETESRRPNDAGRTSNDTQASRLMKLAQNVELFHTPDGEPFATVAVNSHKETFPVKSGDFRDWLAFRYWNTEKAMPSSQAVQDVVNGLGGQARFEGEMKGVHLRVAEEHGGSLYLDLGNERWEAVRITADGWSVTDNPPVKFRRTRGTLPLPKPEPGGSIEDLWRFANVNEDDRPLVLAWLAAVLRPNKPFPVLVLHGEQDSGKSTTAKVLRLLVDDNKAPLRSLPKDERDLMIAANNSWVISLDNLSSMSVAQSDWLCRLSTGGGFATRKLFSDGDEILLSLTRPTIMNGIDEVISRSDLLDRSIMLHLPKVTGRCDEATFWADFESARPRILGALLDAVCHGIANIKNVTTEVRSNEDLELPRLADFTLWGMSCEAGFNLGADSFFKSYKNNRAGVHSLALDCDPFAETVISFMKVRGEDVYEEKPSVFCSQIMAFADNLAKTPSFPKNPKSIGRRLQLLAPNLREHGVEYTAPDRNKQGRVMRLKRTRALTEND